MAAATPNSVPLSPIEFPGNDFSHLTARARSSPASECGGPDVPLRIKTRAARLSQPPGRDAFWPGHATSAAMATLRMRALRGGAEHRPGPSPEPDIGADQRASHT